MSTQTVSFRLDEARGLSPLVIVFGPSMRSPAFEGQVELLRQDRTTERTNARLLLVVAEGTSTIDGDRLDESSADDLRTAFGVSADEFRIVLVGVDGRERHRDDAPLQPAVVEERLSGGAA